MTVTRLGRSRDVKTVAETPSAKVKQKKARKGVRPKPQTKVRDAFDAQRGIGPEGIEKLITPPERARAADALSRVPSLAKVVQSVPEGVAQALVLKAIAARADRIATDPRAVDVVKRFARQIDALPDAELLEKATVLDLDSRVSTSDADPMPMWNKRGTVRGDPGDGAATDNDGLFQRFTAACGPAVIQMMRAQTDPVIAFAINSEGRTSEASTGETAAFQRALLEEYGGVAIGRRESWLTARLNNAMARLGLAGQPTDAAVAQVRAKFDGFPSDAELKLIRGVKLPKRDEGIGTDDFQQMLDGYVGRLTGAHYTQTSPPEGFARGQAWRHLDAVERAVKAGFDVPFGLVEPAHWMLISAVKGSSPERQFLVSDPDGGRTAWVTEKKLVDGTFGDDQFHLPKPGERPAIDCFFLPEKSVN